MGTETQFSKAALRLIFSHLRRDTWQWVDAVNIAWDSALAERAIREAIFVCESVIYLNTEVNKEAKRELAKYIWQWRALIEKDEINAY